MLKKCSDPGCDPREQVRGEMGPGDYKDVEFSQGPRTSPPGPIHKTVDHYKYVEVNDENRGHFRVCCFNCGLATAWAPKDFPGMPGAGSDWVIKTWNDEMGNRHHEDVSSR